MGFFADTKKREFQRRLLLYRYMAAMEPNFAESQKKVLLEVEMEADEQVCGAGACKNEQKEETSSIDASSSPTHSSAEDIFSDTMELTNYLHRRVQEIGKQFRHRPFRIYTREKPESQFMSCPSRAASEPSLANSAVPRACEFPIVRENAQSCLREGGGISSLAEMKPSSASCLSKRDWSVCAEANHNENPFNSEIKSHHFYDSRPGDGGACHTEELAWAHTQKHPPSCSENADNSAHGKGDDAPLKHGEEKVPSRSEIAQVFLHGAHDRGSGMEGMSPKHANLAGSQEALNSSTCLDAGNCPALRHTEGKNLQFGCSTPSPHSSQHVLCHASSDMPLIPAHFRSDLELPSLQDHAMSDVQDGGGFPCSTHTEIVQSHAVAENVGHSLSSVDSSECDNCGNDVAKGGSTLSRVSNGADEKKSEEIDAMSEAMHMETCRQEDEDGIPAESGGDVLGRAERENDALDLLLNAMHVTSTEGAAAKQSADAYQNTACILEGLGHGSIQNSLNRNSPKDTPSLRVRSFPIVKKRSNRSAKALAKTETSRSSASPVRFRSLQAVSEVDLPNYSKGDKKHAANKLDDRKVSDSSPRSSKGKRERTSECLQNTLPEEGISKQEKREIVIDRGDAHEGTGEELLPATMPVFGGIKQEQGMPSRRARLQVLPTKFSDSVLQPWKKGDRRRG